MPRFFQGLLVAWLLWLWPGVVAAHCPLCTAGAGVLAVAASWLGISTVVVGLFIGAFALALGLWLAKMIKVKYLPHQDRLVVATTVFLTIIPIMPLIREYRPLYIAWVGEYGTLWHNTYLINLFVLGSVIGVVILGLSPWLSRQLTKWRRGQTWPYQGLSLTFGLLLAGALILQLTL